MALIFTVDDDSNIRGLIKVLFEDRGHEVVALENGKQCLDRLDENPSVIFLDVAMPVMGGMEALKTIKNSKSNLPVIMVTGVDDVASAVKAMKFGAFDYIVKPFDELRLFSVLDKAIEQTSLVGQVRYLQGELSRMQGISTIVGASPALTDTLKKFRKLAPVMPEFYFLVRVGLEKN